ncbi:hypothetical protein [Leptospira weilii]|uniref:hypothetical protein n=1 Tax=Leptospira weilii TaxID=28184 RepID=UPI0002BE62DB|nr:hypothetical protein [Leptospira weilii]EMN44214.1 hypothetical protein LEP1GSC086_2889 [Leptospira weilii str. LNT 1234]MDL5245904.1 hypothetical protein [Leptospira weilii]QDK24442.1 hypothetical protein FHG67_18305 [Leptospira weilii]QDK28401.1 hypothetical protein FHG68_18360 [Leptospira weilii]
MGLAIALSCSIIGLVVGLVITFTAVGDYKTFPIYSTLAAFSTSYVVWNLFVERKENYNVIRGIILGVLIVALSHHLTFYFVIISENIEYWILDFKSLNEQEPPMNPFIGFFAVSLGTLISLFVCGWITLPLGAFLGWFFTKYRKLFL